ncbi:hypothetical protein DPSP01_010837 [Paraphaeosphaeria sporulosa]|uniref:Beta/gamma crystallin 'Greek key' domain-containing protein n=1 Tax=Paraphaeosphaeria sporulosa TaxID=1460663 RepID=A0A177C0M6_9PLEO|nr:uncharacterized protein CC84DRAFT_1189713 [Paraphaeosphaeria sporulosa]OAG01344.1 hypothetical protein CC84DRAFT_1189713 [Paraphaeosphaeria sporulosa]
MKAGIATLGLLAGLLDGVQAQYVATDHIRVFLFGQTSYFSEVAVDVRNNTCLSLDNNLIDGKVQSVLVGGHNIWDVYQRNDEWYCILYDNFDCTGSEASMITVAGGTNNLATAGWGNRVHGLRCINDDPA